MNYQKKYIKYKNKYTHLKGGTDYTFDINKIKGVLYGVAVGDALGTRYEFSEAIDASIKVDSDMLDDHLPLLGGGPFNTLPGQISDDTEMSLCLLGSLANLGVYDQNDVAKKYIEWFRSKPIDIGKTIYRSLFTRKPSLTRDDMIKNSMELNSASLSNGVLMRISPLAVYSIKLSTKDLNFAIKKECELTHPNAIIYDAVSVYCLAIKYLINGITIDELYDKLENECCKTPRVKILLRDSFYNPEPSYVIDEDLRERYIKTDDKKYQGYFGVAFQNAFYELFNGTDFESSLINIIKRGGDTDTNCAIAGGLLGAYYGYDSINKNWINTIKNTNYERINKYPYLGVNKIDTYINQLFNK